MRTAASQTMLRLRVGRKEENDPMRIANLFRVKRR
jgi:hypothetical protein